MKKIELLVYVEDGSHKRYLCQELLKSCDSWIRSKNVFKPGDIVRPIFTDSFASRHFDTLAFSDLSRINVKIVDKKQEGPECWIYGVEIEEGSQENIKMFFLFNLVEDYEWSTAGARGKYISLDEQIKYG